MKKYKFITGLILIIATLGLLLFVIKRYYISQATSIIGGADGPTAIFIAGKFGDLMPIYLIIGVPIIIIITLFFLRNK